MGGKGREGRRRNNNNNNSHREEKQETLYPRIPSIVRISLVRCARQVIFPLFPSNTAPSTAHLTHETLYLHCAAFASASASVPPPPPPLPPLGANTKRWGAECWMKSAGCCSAVKKISETFLS